MTPTMTIRQKITAAITVAGLTLLTVARRLEQKNRSLRP